MFHSFDDHSQSINECHELDLSTTLQEICENDEVEVTSLENDINNHNDSSSYDGRSSCEVKKSSNFGLQDGCDICQACDTKIFQMDKLNVDGKYYHKNCFRCSKCQTVLTVSNFTITNNLIYCKTHVMELCKIRGKLDKHRDTKQEIITGNVIETIPVIDTKGLLAKFRELENGGGPTPQPRYVNHTNFNSNLKYVKLTDEIIKYDDFAPDDLPPPEFAKAMVAKFNAMEICENIPSPKCTEKMQQKARVNMTPNTNVRLQTNNVYVSTNKVQCNKEEFPSEGSTRNLLTKFQNIFDAN